MTEYVTRRGAADLAQGTGTYDQWVALMQQKKPTEAAALR